MDFGFFRGDTRTLTLTIRKADASGPYDLTGARLWFTAKYKLTDADAAAVIALTSTGGGIQITNAVGGIAKVNILPAHTSGIAGKRTPLEYDVQGIGADGTVFTPSRGVVTILPDVTKATS